MKDAENLGEAPESQGVRINWRGILSSWRVEAVLAFRVALDVERVAAPLQAPGVDPELAQHSRLRRAPHARRAESVAAGAEHEGRLVELVRCGGGETDGNGRLSSL